MTQQPQYYSVLYDKKMKKLSDWLFDIGFFPILHEAVKRDFLSWYYEASQSEIFDNEVDLDNSDLIELTDQARQRAENFDQNNPLIELIDVFEDLKSTIDTYIIYIAFFCLAYRRWNFCNCGIPSEGSGLYAYDRHYRQHLPCWRSRSNCDLQGLCTSNEN